MSTNEEILVAAERFRVAMDRATALQDISRAASQVSDQAHQDMFAAWAVAREAETELRRVAGGRKINERLEVEAP